MSLLLFALITCGAAASGWAAGRLLQRAARASASPSLPAGEAPGALLPLPTDLAVDPTPSFPLALGDVLTRGAAEAVLCGAWVAREEDADLAAIFVSAGPAGGPIVAAFPRPSDEIFWLTRVTDDAALAGPYVVEVEGVAYTLARRLPVVVAHVGDDLPAVGLAREALLYEYRGDGGRCLIALASKAEAAGAWRGLVAVGMVCSLGSIERLPGPFRTE